MKISNSIYNSINSLAKRGDIEFDAANYDIAIIYYKEALDLLPKPISQWKAGDWLYTAIGDAYYMKSEYINSLEYFNKALIEYNEIYNPFIWLRLGECNYEIGYFNKAKRYLSLAKYYGGEELFKDENEKYINFLTDEKGDC